ncbi:MAG: flagellar basal body-associated protein FliL [Rhodospirillaceae bacterium]|nr:flagellar basal body-associated protein FliL [Rhodospirillales bacterium]
MIFMVIAFLLMVGVIIGGLYFWGIDPLEKFNVLVGNAPAPTEKGTTAKAAVVAQPSFVDFGLLIVPVVLDREVKKQAEMILRLEVASDKKEVVAQNLPRLQNAFLTDMMAFLPYQLRSSSTLDLVAVRRRLIALCDKVLGPGLVKDVSIEQSSVK